MKMKKRKKKTKPPPEGPDIKRMSEGLARSISGCCLTGVDVLSGRYSKGKGIPGVRLLGTNEDLAQSKVLGVGTHGKFSYVIFSNDVHLHVSMGMSGSWSLEKGKHSKARLDFMRYETRQRFSIYFDDQRNFGTLAFVQGREALIEKLKSLGPDILDDSLPDEKFVSALRRVDEKNVCVALTDQHVLAGIGNYLKAETLWHAKLSPLRNVSFFADSELLILVCAARSCARESYKSGGNTFTTHKIFDGSAGGYKDQLCCYNRKFDPDGLAVVRTVTPDNRVTHWVPDRQK